MKALSIQEEDEAMRRRTAMAIAQLIAPAIQEALATIPSFVMLQPVALKADKAILDAAKQVAGTVTAYDQAKFSSFGEAGARLAMERAARALKSRLEQREAELSQVKQTNREPKETSNGSTAR